MHDRSAVFDQAATVLLAVKAIDAAAADDLHGGAKELLDKLFDSSVVFALRAMLEPLSSGKPLLSHDALVNVMRAFVSDGGLAERMFKWKVPSEEAKLHVAAAHAIISLLDDVTPCRFDPARPANHAVAGVASGFTSSLASNPELALDVQQEIGNKALKRIEKAIHS
jgi:hypothetical protein